MFNLIELCQNYLTQLFSKYSVEFLYDKIFLLYIYNRRSFSNFSHDQFYDFTINNFHENCTLWMLLCGINNNSNCTIMLLCSIKPSNVFQGPLIRTMSSGCPSPRPLSIVFHQEGTRGKNSRHSDTIAGCTSAIY